MFSYHAIAVLLYHVFLYVLQHNLHVAFYVQLHIFRIVCKDHSDLFTLCLNHYVYVHWSILPVLANQPSMSLYLLVVLCTFGVMAADRGVGLGSGCLTVGMWDFHMCFCVHARADCGRCPSVQFAPSAQFGCILYTYCIHCMYI